MDFVAPILAATATVVAAAAAVGSWRAARQASQAALTLAAIERDRRHAELTPHLEVSCTSTGDRATLWVALTGPMGLEHLDEMSVTVRDDIRGRKPIVAGGPTADQIAEHVWGPYRFVPRVDGADSCGRCVLPVKLLLGDARPFTLERTRPPQWSMDTGEWSEQYRYSPVKLTLSCWREGYKPWTVPLEVSVSEPSPE